MSNELAVISKDKIQLVKDMICKGASDNELEMFVSVCNKTGLDPLSKQCWAVKRWDSSLGREVFSFQTGVDGFRVIANRSNKYAGQLGPFWCGDDGAWKDVWLDSKPPVAAKIGVIRADFKEPLWAVAKFSSYAAKKKDGSLAPFWLKMPDLMIAKVAECLAFRKAFPQDLSGVYSDTEIEQDSVLKDVEQVKEIEPQKEINNDRGNIRNIHGELKDKQHDVKSRETNSRDSEINDLNTRIQDSGTERNESRDTTQKSNVSVGSVQSISERTQEEIKVYPDKTKIKINKIQAESLKTIGEGLGYSIEQISHCVYALTKKILWSELNYDEYEMILKSLKDNSKRFS